MKLSFRKNEEQVISVYLVTEEEGEARLFTYAEMINQLLQSEQLETPDIDDSFSDQEVDSIKAMVADINEAVRGTDVPDADETKRGEDDAKEIPF